MRHTGFGDTGTDGASLESGSRQVKSLLQAIDGLKFDIAESLRGVGQLVLHDADIGHAASSEEVGDIVGSRFEGKVSNVGGKRRLGGEVKRLANSVSAASLALYSMQVRYCSS